MVKGIFKGPIVLLSTLGMAAIFMSLGVEFFYPTRYIISMTLHALLEGVSSTLAIILFLFLFNFRRFFKDKVPRIAWLLAGFFSLGCFGLIHASLNVGNNFVLMSAMSMSLGGLFFALSFVPAITHVDTQKYFIGGVISCILLLAASFLWQPGLSPVMFNSIGPTSLAKGLYVVGGIGFLLGMIYYLRNYQSSHNKVSFYIALFCLIHFISCFANSVNTFWNMGWWLWHLLRAISSIIVFFAFYKVFEVLIEEYYDLNRKLARANTAMARANVTPAEDTFPKPEFTYETNQHDAVTKLARSLVHELNNVLNTVVNTAYLIQDKYKDDSYLVKRSEMIIQTGMRGADATKQFSLFSNYDRAEENIFDMRELVEDIRKASETGLSEKHSIEFVLDKEALFINSDFSRLYQVMMNLILNITESIPDNHTIVVNAYVVHNEQEKTKEWVVTKIYDKGNRISSEKINEIFNAFEGLKSQEASISSIAIAEEIFRFLGGRLDVNAKALDDSCITISFPYIEEKSANKLKRDISEKNMRNLLRGKRVLLLDDEDYILDTTRDILAMCGAEVHTAKNAEEAGILLETQSEFDLALFDVMLPDKTGIEFWHEIESVYTDLRVIFMSGYSDQTLIESIQGQDNISFIQKPFMPNDLLLQIGDDLDLFKKEPELPKNL